MDNLPFFLEFFPKWYLIYSRFLNSIYPGAPIFQHDLVSDLGPLKPANKEIEAIYIQGHLTGTARSVLQTDFH